MSGITDSDRQLIGELQALIDRLAGMRQALYSSRLGCACNERQLCALHAAVWNHLNQASEELALAIGQAQSD